MYTIAHFNVILGRIITIKMVSEMILPTYDAAGLIGAENDHCARSSH